ncbi:hypothetical protein L2E82_36269 [Cichorium intybus]|uniref:Uncharacterized protein n=1 Tax=Cichorium intybus TaxID=13427 RepID=A0ACB9BR54_CICIN|nr:hypothetical protein L2E82_36269 [Cichorium intybus]
MSCRWYYNPPPVATQLLITILVRKSSHRVAKGGESHNHLEPLLVFYVAPLVKYLIRDSCTLVSGKHARRIQLAEELLTGERCILESASSWLIKGKFWVRFGL